MTVGERVKEVRKENGLSQEEFAHKLGFDTRGAIANIELERTEASDKLLSLISNLFGVREEWLRTGEGEMMAADARSDKIAAFLGDLTRDDDDDFRKRFVEMLADLSPADWKLLERMAEKLTQKKRKAHKGFPRVVAGGSSDQVACVHPHKPQLAEIGFFQQFQNGVDVILS